jgi:hypothetical protein
MKTLPAAILAVAAFATVAAVSAYRPVRAQQEPQHWHTLTEADAARINQRRPSDWLPKVKAGDVLAVDDTLRIIG